MEISNHQPFQIKSYIPISRILYSDCSEPLSFIWFCPHEQNLSAYPPCFIKRVTLLPEGNHGIHGISTHKVYPHDLLPGHVVCSYHTFSPLPRQNQGGNFLWHFLSRNYFQSHPLDGVVLYVVRTFLTFFKRMRDKAVCSIQS